MHDINELIDGPIALFKTVVQIADHLFKTSRFIVSRFLFSQSIQFESVECMVEKRPSSARLPSIADWPCPICSPVLPQITAFSSSLQPSNTRSSIEKIRLLSTTPVSAHACLMPLTVKRRKGFFLWSLAPCPC